MATAVIKILTSDDQPLLEAFLQPRIESSMFLLSNARKAGLVDQGQPYQATYAAAVEDGALVAVVAHAWKGNLLLQAPVYLPELVAAAVQASQRPIRGLVGPDEQVLRAKSLLQSPAPELQMDEADPLYRLRLAEMIVPEALASGRLRGRQIEARDVELVTGWRVDYSIEDLGDIASPELYEECRASINRSLADGHTWLLEDQGRPVACSSFNAALPEAVQIGGVWTPPALRNRGYARAVVAASLLEARAQGVALAILFTGQNNLPAQRAYRALGFEHVGDYRLTIFRSAISYQV